MKTRHRSLLCSLLAIPLLLATATAVRAQSAMYFKFANGIDGSVVRENFTGAIDVLSYSFGVGRGVTINPGPGGGVEASSPQISEFTITAPFDSKAYVGLFIHSLTGESGNLGKLSVVAGGGQTSFVPLTTELEGVISGLSVSQAAGDDGGGFMSIIFTLTKFTVTTVTRDNQGGLGTPVHYSWDVRSQTGQ